VREARSLELVELVAVHRGSEMPRRPAASAAAAAVYLRHPTAVEEEVDPVEDEVADAVRPLAPELSPSPVPSQASSRLSHSTGRHPSHISFDTDAVRRRNNSDGSAVGQITMTSYQPLQWTIPPAFHQPANAGGMEQAQVVLQQPNAMVVYDPPAHELVVYSHSNPPLLTSSPPAESSPMAAVAIRQLQPFSQQIFRGHEEADMHMPVSTRAACNLFGVLECTQARASVTDLNLT
jgi:hypothetical protein